MRALWLIAAGRRGPGLLRGSNRSLGVPGGRLDPYPSTASGVARSAEARDALPFMKVDPAGIPFIGTAAAAAIILGLAGFTIAALLALMLGAVFLGFFRDPERRPPADPRAVVAPADGRILVAGDAVEGVAPPGSWRQVSVFLSPLDVHVNRVPVSGRITRVDARRGTFLAAYRGEAAVTNQRTEIWIDRGDGTVVCRQVVGALARRIVCRARPADEVRAGDRFGIIKFGSRVDLFMPPTAELRVAVGDRVRGGETIVATF